MGGAKAEALPATRVLVVEDEPGIVDFVRRGLRATGFTVEVAFDGIDGCDGVHLSFRVVLISANDSRRLNLVFLQIAAGFYI